MYAKIYMTWPRHESEANEMATGKWPISKALYFAFIFYPL